MVYSKIVVNFCAQDSDDRQEIVNATSFAVHAKSTLESVAASIEQGANRIRQVASRFPRLIDAGQGCKVFDKDDYTSHSCRDGRSPYLSGDGSEPAYDIMDVIRMAIRFARDEVLPDYDALSWNIHSKRGGLPICTFHVVLHLPHQHNAQPECQRQNPSKFMQVSPAEEHDALHQPHERQATPSATATTPPLPCAPGRPHRSKPATAGDVQCSQPHQLDVASAPANAAAKNACMERRSTDTPACVGPASHLPTTKLPDGSVPLTDPTIAARESDPIRAAPVAFPKGKKRFRISAHPIRAAPVAVPKGKKRFRVSAQISTDTKAAVPEKITVVCNGVYATMLTGTCTVITNGGKQLTPTEFELHAGSKRRKWKVSIRVVEDGEPRMEVGSWLTAHGLAVSRARGPGPGDVRADSAPLTKSDVANAAGTGTAAADLDTKPVPHCGSKELRMQEDITILLEKGLL